MTVALEANLGVGRYHTVTTNADRYQEELLVKTRERKRKSPKKMPQSQSMVQLSLHEQEPTTFDRCARGLLPQLKPSKTEPSLAEVEEKKRQAEQCFRSWNESKMTQKLEERRRRQEGGMPADTLAVALPRLKKERTKEGLKEGQEKWEEWKKQKQQQRREERRQKAKSDKKLRDDFEAAKQITIGRVKAAKERLRARQMKMAGTQGLATQSQLLQPIVKPQPQQQSIKMVARMSRNPLGQPVITAARASRKAKKTKKKRWEPEKVFKLS